MPSSAGQSHPGSFPAASPAGRLQHRHTEELAELRGKLRRSHEECHAFQEQVDAAATVIMTLLAENAALREHATGRSAALIPIPLSRDENS
ncbi:hypothetical protein [Streptomyces sp. NPDC056061]|uniref:hypothetical protein n=1 Tax=Streptomyces sp. NPDC056061 TaxID=3345700 RepID=UPI0035D64ABA